MNRKPSSLTATSKTVDLEQQVQAVRDAFYALMPMLNAVPVAQPHDCYPIAVRDDSLIVRLDDGYFLVPYTKDKTGQITFAVQADWQEVEQQWVPVGSGKSAPWLPLKIGKRNSASDLERLAKLEELLNSGLDIIGELTTDERAEMAEEASEGEPDEGKAAEEVMATVGGVKYPADAFLVTEHSFKPSTWHLRVLDKDGKPDHGLMGAAWAALHGGYRGSKYDGPGKEDALKKLVALYKKEDMPLPTDKAGDPALWAVKALGGDRIGGYACLWGDKNRRDLTGEWFTPKTEELTAIFKSIGKLPWMYHHGMDSAVKAEVAGIVDVLQPDDVGLWYEAQRTKSGKYREAIDKLISDGALGTSSSTGPGMRKAAPSGEILRWPILEISGTPTPAEPRMMERPIAEIKAAFDEVGLKLPDTTYTPGGRGDEESRQQALRLELERIGLLTLEV